MYLRISKAPKQSFDEGMRDLLLSALGDRQILCRDRDRKDRHGRSQQDRV